MTNTRTKLLAATILSTLLVGSVAAADPAPDREARRKARKAEIIAQFDQNGDGKLDAQEKENAREARAYAIFQKLDANKDGALSWAEFREGRMKMKMMRKKHWMKHHGQPEGGEQK